MATEPLPDLLARLSSQGAAPSHLPRLAALRDLCERSPQCVALALVGSFAQGLGDRISDLDLAAFVSDDGEAAFMEQAHEVLSRGEVLNDYGQVRPEEVAFRKYVYLDFSSCEFHSFNVNTAFKLRPPFVTVWDPTGFLASLVVNEPPPRHETFAAFPHGDAGLIWELMDCVKWLRRGRHMLAKNHLRKLVSAMDGVEGSTCHDTDPPGPTSLSPQGFAWTGLFAQDIERLAEFYENKVGLRLIEGGKDCCIFDAGAGALFEIWRNGRQLDRRKTPSEQSMIVGFLVNDLESAVNALKERGLHPDSPIDSYLGTRWVYFTDPEGNRFELKDKMGGA